MKKVFHESHFTNRFVKLEVKATATRISFKLHREDMFIGGETFTVESTDDDGHIAISNLTNAILEVLLANGITGFDMVDIYNDIYYSKVLNDY